MYDFPGTVEEHQALRSAVERHCAPHEPRLDQDVLKRLVFYRRCRETLRRAEWLEEPGWRAA
jgi:hypothetical protein